jgi:carbamoyltransferase
MSSVVLGLNGYKGLLHDAAAAVVIDGVAVSAVEEERLSRRKRAMNEPPIGAISEALALAAVDVSDVDLIVYPWEPRAMGVDDDEVEAAIRGWFIEAGLSEPRQAAVRYVKHHEAHAWSGIGFAPAEWRDRRIGALVVDGSGESTSGGLFVLRDSALQQRWLIPQEASLGIYYEAVSAYLGFGFGQEGKTMGLASYGQTGRRDVPQVDDLRLFDALPTAPLHGEAAFAHYKSMRGRIVDDLANRHGLHLSFNDRADVAFAAQEVVSARILEYVAEILPEVDVLVFSGGVALNCSINSGIADACVAAGVQLVIPPPASDTGIAIGAAIAASDNPLRVTVPSFGLGREYPTGAVVDSLAGLGARVEESNVDELASEIVSRSAICGWLASRAEIGPRALGCRCLVARPDDVLVRDRINYLKGRESWRPLAPSVTEAEFERSFEGHPSPHMLIASVVKAEARDALAGVVHVDATSRPQVVARDSTYARLVRAVGKQNGIEAVICTSFNRAGEPMVYSPADAFQTAQAMGLDLLAGDGWCVHLRDAAR